MAKQVEAQSDHVVPFAAERGDQFFGVLTSAVVGSGLDLDLRPAKRGMRDDTPVLRSPLRVGRGNQVELEVFADPQGTALRVGWQATRNIGGGLMNNTGLGRDLQLMRTWGAGNAKNERALSGILQSFDMVFQSVVQQLVDAIRIESGPSTNGFLGT